ncbi:unnamed protein product [Anisakis simplex]|uniref:Sodium-bile acid cotransporter n=1 Tax=Anisakis simplex TaxID=6269 RepID=A0A0M3JY11_ANISI|nr:unnamed protein product [Anisakis simplex]
MGSCVKRGCPLLFLVRLLLNIAVSATSSSLHAFTSVNFSPPFIHDLIVGKNTTLQMTVGIDPHHEYFKQFAKNRPLKIQLKSMDEEVVSVVDAENELVLDQFPLTTNQTFQTNFTLSGHFLGKTAVKVRLFTANEQNDNEDESSMQIANSKNSLEEDVSIDVWVSYERSRLINRLFLTTLIILIVIANMLMGCEVIILDLKIVLETIKKPVAPNKTDKIVHMNLFELAYCIANVVFVSRGMHSFALGLFVTGCAPGGGASNYWTLLLNANLPVSITMTFISTLSAVVMMPLWIYLFGQHFLQGYDSDTRLKVPYWKIVSSLLTLVIPLLIGVCISKWKPCFRDKARKLMRPFILFVLIFLIVFGTIANFYMVRLITWTALLGGLLLPWCGFAFGCITAVVFRQKPSTVAAIAIETGIQNTGIAIMLLKFSFPDPDADISSLIPVIAASLTPIPLLTAVGIHALMRYIKKKQSGTDEVYGVKQLSSVVDNQLCAVEKDVEEGSPLVERAKLPPGEGSTSVNPSDNCAPFHIQS